MDKIYAALGATDNLKILKGYRVTSGRRMVVNSGRIIVHNNSSNYCSFSQCIILYAIFCQLLDIIRISLLIIKVVVLGDLGKGVGRAQASECFSSFI